MRKANLALVLILLAFCFPVDLDASGNQGSLREDSPTLDGAHGVRFGMGLTEAVKSILREYGASPSRHEEGDAWKIIQYDNINTSLGRLAKLRLMFHPRRGVFWLEEEHSVQWNLQRPDAENLDHQQMRLAGVLTHLRSRYGPERFLENPDLSERFQPNDFVAATWRFPHDRWIHVIFEPQDWSLYPELNTIVIIYRDSSRDPR